MPREKAGTKPFLGRWVFPLPLGTARAFSVPTQPPRIPGGNRMRPPEESTAVASPRIGAVRYRRVEGHYSAIFDWAASTGSVRGVSRASCGQAISPGEFDHRRGPGLDFIVRGLR